MYYSMFLHLGNIPTIERISNEIKFSGYVELVSMNV